jgi:type II secretory ATPase GspE/PulE/Tfp pilus assembly ATPase PilB-like protein
MSNRIDEVINHITSAIAHELSDKIIIERAIGGCVIKSKKIDNIINIMSINDEDYKNLIIVLKDKSRMDIAQKKIEQSGVIDLFGIYTKTIINKDCNSNSYEDMELSKTNFN